MGEEVLTPLHEKGEDMLYEGIDNMIWGGSETTIVRWCERNKVFDEITEAEIEEIWM